MKMKFNFEGLPGMLVFENPTPNKYGNICGKFTWGEIEEYPTFRSIQQAEEFVQNQDALSDYIDQAARAGEDA